MRRRFDADAGSIVLEVILQKEDISIYQSLERQWIVSLIFIPIYIYSLTQMYIKVSVVSEKLLQIYMTFT